MKTDAVCLAAIKKSPHAIQFIDNLSEDLMLAAVATNWKSILYLSGYSQKVADVAALRSGDALEYLEISPSLDVAKGIIEKHPSAIRHIKEPAEELSFVAVARNGLVLEHIQKQTNSLCLVAVMQNGLALEFVKEPTEEIYKAALVQNPTAFKYIASPSEDLCLEAINLDGTNLRYIKNPSSDLVMAAIANEANMFAKLPVAEQTEELCIAVVSREPEQLKNVARQTEAICLAAVNAPEGWTAHEHVQILTPAVMRAIILVDPKSWGSQVFLSAMLRYRQDNPTMINYFIRVNKMPHDRFCRFRKSVVDEFELKHGIKHQINN